MLLTRHGFELIMGFIQNLQLLTTNYYNAVTNLRHLQISTANTKSSKPSLVVAGNNLVASNNHDIADLLHVRSSNYTLSLPEL